MGADTPLRGAGGPVPVDDEPGVDGASAEVARAAVTGGRARGGDGDRTVAVDGPCRTVRPPGREPPEQGRRPSAGAALLAVAAQTSGFAFGAGPQRGREMNSRDGNSRSRGGERGSAGEFRTAGPNGAEQFRRPAAELDRAAAGMSAPVFLPDRQYRPHRPGGPVRRPPGAPRPVLRGPGGAPGEDVRPAAPRRPPWAVDPVAGRGSTADAVPVRVAASERGGRRAGELLDGRWALTVALRRGAGGGVFLGADAASGAEVVVKQARAPLGADRVGVDARAALRREAESLERLADSGLTPRVHALVERRDSLFLVREHVPGRSLGSWVSARLRRDGSPGVPWAEAGPMALALLGLLERVHRRGLVLRDLSPGSVLVAPDGAVRLVGLELAVPVGVLTGPAGAPGYRAPEHSGPRPPGPAAYSTDLFALGGLFFLLATGHDPLLSEDLPAARPVGERLGRWLALAARDGETARRLAPATLGLRTETADRRWELGRVRAELDKRRSHRASPQP